MGTPFITRLERPKIDGYDASLTHDKQPPHIPAGFIDSMSVREAVFVNEQGFPLEVELDKEDRRSCHWVIYASVKTIVEPEERDPVTNCVIRPRRSETKSTPIGTIRIVPFPHDPHPPEGSRWVGGKLQSPYYTFSTVSGTTGRTSGTQGSSAAKPDENIPPSGGGNGDGTAGRPPRSRAWSLADQARLSAPLPFGLDRPTDFHDGKEPYVKLGRVAVLPDYRGQNVAAQLWAAAKKWLQENPTYFNPSVRELGLTVMKVSNVDEIPKWKGLVCVHAQEAAVKVYERWGFKVDKAFGKFYEEGVPHVGMFQRLEITSTDPKI